MVAAAYLSVKDRMRETALPLQSHTAADSQTGSIGDVEVTLINDEQIITCYEMKDKRVTIVDIENAIKKIATTNSPAESDAKTSQRNVPPHQANERTYGGRAVGVEIA